MGNVATRLEGEPLGEKILNVASEMHWQLGFFLSLQLKSLAELQSGF